MVHFSFTIYNILKNSSKDELLKTIHSVNEGGIYFNGKVGEALQQYQQSSKVAVPALSWREKQVLELIAERHTNPEIADKLFVGKYTLDNHRKNLTAKLKVKNTAMLIRFAIKHKLI